MMGEAQIAKGIFCSIAVLFGSTAVGFVIANLSSSCDPTLPLAIQSLGTVFGLVSTFVHGIVGLRRGLETSLLQAILALALVASFSLIRFTCIAESDWQWFPWNGAMWTYIACTVVLLTVSWIFYRQTRQVPHPRS